MTDKLEIIEADGLKAAGVAHGFFTRIGGVSTGIYGGLNCGAGSNDDPAAVAENRSRVQLALGADSLQSLHQVHSPTAIYVDAPMANRPQADAMVTDKPGIALGALSADCAPLLFLDPQARVIAAAHAGWKGALTGVIEATVDLMVSHGATRSDIRAAVGPCISQRNYEVGPEFLDRFLDEDPDNARFFAAGAGDRAMFDLPGFCLQRVADTGVDNRVWTGHCTYGDERRFYSFRRATHSCEADYGRLIAAISFS